MTNTFFEQKIRCKMWNESCRVCQWISFRRLNGVIASQSFWINVNSKCARSPSMYKIQLELAQKRAGGKSEKKPFTISVSPTIFCFANEWVMLSELFFLKYQLHNLFVLIVWNRNLSTWSISHLVKVSRERRHLDSRRQWIIEIFRVLLDCWNFLGWMNAFLWTVGVVNSALRLPATFLRQKIFDRWGSKFNCVN